MKTLKDVKAFNAHSGIIKFINPDEFFSNIKVVIIRSYNDEVASFEHMSDSTPEDDFVMNVTTKKHVLKKTKGLAHWHAFSRLLDMLRQQITAPYLGSEETEVNIYRQIEDDLEPTRAIRLSDNEYFTYDPNSFIYYLTSDGSKGELVYQRSIKHLTSVKLQKIIP